MAGSSAPGEFGMSLLFKEKRPFVSTRTGSIRGITYRVHQMNVKCCSRNEQILASC